MTCLPARRVLASGPICSVEECSCGTLHVTLGAITIRLRPEVVASVEETLGLALERLLADRRTTIAHVASSDLPS